MYTTISILAGFFLDLLFGDPYWMPHPVRLMGKTINWLDKRLWREEQNSRQQIAAGTLLVLIVSILSFVPAALGCLAVYAIHPLAGLLLESFLCYQILATKCLKVESGKVYRYVKAGDQEGARLAVSMIVGRDTDSLDEEGIVKAAVETVAENTSDGSVAPLCYLILGGPPLGLLYKAMNTMDSMLGYKNERYLYFGRTAAKLDDLVNFLPSRIAALAMILASFLLQLDGTSAWRIYRRDRKKHASPNSAQTESVCAGALGVSLAGDAKYFGKIVKKPVIGDAKRSIEAEDIRRANRLLYVSAFLVFSVGMVLRVLLVPALGVLGWGAFVCIGF